MRTQLEVNHYLQDTTIKNARNLLDIELCIRNNNLHLPNNVIIHENGISFVEFYKWFENRNKIPTTYEECWKVRFEVGGETTLEEFHNVSGYYSGPLGALQKLLCCRDAYWKIAGEQMGLDNFWEPDWKSGEQKKHCIYYGAGIIQKGSWCNYNSILAFPTEEMRDAFYENFKNEIEQCKELL